MKNNRVEAVGSDEIFRLLASDPCWSIHKMSTGFPSIVTIIEVIYAHNSALIADVEALIC